MRPRDLHPKVGLGFLPLVVLLTAAGAGCAASSLTTAPGAAAQGEGDPMPDLEMADFWTGKPVRLSGLQGKVVLLDIWASWCVPCKDELPALDEMARRLRKEGVEIVAVSIDEDRAAAEAFLARKKKWSLTLTHDPAGIVPSALDPPKMPTSYLIDRAGILRGVSAGYEPGDAARIEARLRELAAAR